MKTCLLPQVATHFTIVNNSDVMVCAIFENPSKMGQAVGILAKLLPSDLNVT